MGKKTQRAILRGVGAGLRGIAGARREQRAEDKEEARQAKEDALKERELSMREKESRIRVQNLELQQLEQKTKIAHGQLMKTAMASDYTNPDTGYGSVAMADALTKYVGNGIAYRPNPDKTAENKGLPVWDIGTYKTDPETGKQVAGPDGKPVFLPLSKHEKLNTLAFKSEEQYARFIHSNLDPSYLMAMTNANVTYESTRQKQKALDESISGKLEQRKGEQEIKESEAREAKLRAEATGKKKTPAQAEVATRRGIGGDIERTQKEADSDKTFHTLIAKKYQGIGPDEAFKITQIKSDPKIRKIFHESIAAVLDGTEPEADLYRDAREVGVPVEFIRDLLAEAQELQEEFKADEPGLLSRAWDKIFN
jgi:hypothetical protein